MIEIHGHSYIVNEVKDNQSVTFTEPYAGKTEVFVPVVKLLIRKPDPRLRWEKLSSPEVPSDICIGETKQFGVSLSLKRIKDLVCDVEQRTSLTTRVEHMYQQLSALDVLHEHFDLVCKWLPEAECIDGMKFMKYCKYFGLLSDEFTRVQADLVFTKSRNPTSRKLGFDEFQNAIVLLTTFLLPDTSAVDRIYEYSFAIVKSRAEITTRLWRLVASRTLLQEGLLQCAATCIQATIRMYIIRALWFSKGKQGCIKVQGLWRIHLAKCEANRRRAELQKKEREAEERLKAQQIQRAYRQYRRYQAENCELEVRR